MRMVPNPRDSDTSLPRIRSLLQRYAQLSESSDKLRKHHEPISRLIARLRIAKDLIESSNPYARVRNSMALTRAALYRPKTGEEQLKNELWAKELLLTNVKNTELQRCNLEIIEARIRQLDALEAEIRSISNTTEKTASSSLDNLRLLELDASGEKIKSSLASGLPYVPSVLDAIVIGLTGGALLGFMFSPHTGNPYTYVAGVAGGIALGLFISFGHKLMRTFDRIDKIARIASHDYENEISALYKQFEERSSALANAVQHRHMQCAKNVNELTAALLPYVPDAIRAEAEKLLSGPEPIAP